MSQPHPIPSVAGCPRSLTLPSPSLISDYDRFHTSERASWGRRRGCCSEEHFSRKALRLVAEKRLLCQSFLPTSPSQMALCNGYIFSLSKVLSALFSCEMTTGVCGRKLPQKEFAFLSMGPLWASRGQIDSVGLFHL